MSRKKGRAMKTARMILFVILVLLLSVIATGEMAPVQDKGGISMTNLRLLLNSFAALGEGDVENVLPGLNRRNREYFPRLMAGGEITCDLVLSKSTGRRTAIVAVPVRKNGKVIGALGTSLAVEAISRMLDEKMELPENMFFYALDQKGQTALHRVSALLFAYPSDMGSKSLAKTVTEMLAKPEGAVTYDFYGERSVVFKKFPLTGWVFAIGIVTGRPGQPVAELPPLLSEADKEITADLHKLA